MRSHWPIAVAIAILGCGGRSGDDFCSQAPTFTNEIRPIVQEKCLQCHSAALEGTARNGAPAGLDFDTYESIDPYLTEFADAISSGREPPMGLDPPVLTTPDERDLVSDWRMCGFKR